MKKKMLIWIGAALMATLAVACGKKNDGATTTPATETTPAGGDAYGGAAAPEGTTAPAEGGEAAPAEGTETAPQQ